MVDAKSGGVLNNERQEIIAAQCTILLKGFVRVGITGLVDEATGYEKVKEKHALQAILDAYLRKELAAWAKRFPDEFYEHIYRLRGWTWRGRGTNPPQVV
ncbi:MAG: P63C domain-containing protein, partial [Stenotrophobium sp.]